jgi:hypothetical protein
VTKRSARHVIGSQSSLTQFEATMLGLAEASAKMSVFTGIASAKVFCALPASRLLWPRAETTISVPIGHARLKYAFSGD